MSQPVPDVEPPASGAELADLPSADLPYSDPDDGDPDDGDPADADLDDADDVDPADADAAPDADGDPDRPGFRLAYVPGATPGKWASVWRDRLPDARLELIQLEASAVGSALEAGAADAALGRLPVDKEVFSAIPLYEEVSVVCFSRDHLLAALGDDETVSSADIAEDPVWVPADDVLFAAGGVPGTVPVDPDGTPLAPVPTTADAVATVAANVGVAVLPMSLARLHRRKDVTYRLLVDGPTAPVGLVWPVDRTTDLVEELIGIVRGRTVNSSRGRGGPTAQPAPDKAAGGTTGKGARAGAKKTARTTPAGGKGRHSAGRGGAKASGGGGIPRKKGAGAPLKRKKKGKG